MVLLKTVKITKSSEQRKQNKTMPQDVDSLSNATTKAVKIKNKEEALRKKPKKTRDDIGSKKKDKKKLKVGKIVPEEEHGNGESNVDENGKSEQKQRKTKKHKTRKATQDNMSKTKKARKAETVEHLPTKGEQDLHLEDDAYQIPSEDDTSSQGMTKWITDYYQSRPGLNALQDKIDDFITAHEAQEEQARIEKEEQAAEGGWTVVVHHKGRKKTTDAESGIVVGSASQAAIMDKMATKKNKDVGLDFYRFQKREAKRNEIIMLRSKFEQDKKRVQELRAQRKFRPY